MHLSLRTSTMEYVLTGLRIENERPIVRVSFYLKMTPIFPSKTINLWLVATSVKLVIEFIMCMPIYIYSWC